MDTVARAVKYLTLVGIAGLVIFRAPAVGQLLDAILRAFRGAFGVASAGGSA
jgi:hypothetical protein